MRFQQLKLFRKEGVVFGGKSTKGNPKTKRPFSRKCDVHLILKSGHAVGAWSMLRASNRDKIREIINKAASNFYVTVRRQINVGNHLHLLVHFPSPEAQRRFLRTISALIARHVMNAHKGSAARIKQFWDARPFTRLIYWGKAYRVVKKYLALNSLEAIGFSRSVAKEYLLSLSG